jgi:putative transposase
MGIGGSAGCWSTRAGRYWRVNAKRLWRIWRRERLKVPSKQPKRGRPWLNDGSCVRLRHERPNHVWSYDFVQDRTEDGPPFRMLCVIDEFTRCCLAIAVARRLRSDDVLQCLTGVKTLFIEPDSPWENGYCESFNSKLRDELPNGEMFTTLREAQVLIENWRHAVRPHSSLGYRPPAPEAILPPACGLPYASLRSAHGLAKAVGL